MLIENYFFMKLIGSVILNEDIIKEFKTTEEYEAWQESLLAIIGFTSDEDNEDEELAEELIVDHLNASLELQNGIAKAKYEVGRKINEKLQEEQNQE